MAIGERIREARQRKKITQKKLAEMIGAKHNSISGWEKNVHKPDIDSIVKMANIFEVSPLWLLGKEDADFGTTEVTERDVNKQRSILSEYLTNERISKEVEEVIKAYLKLSIDNRNMVRKLLDLPPVGEDSQTKNGKQSSETSQHIA